MLHSTWAVVHKGRIEIMEDVGVPDGTQVLVTFLPDEESEFWRKASQISLDKVWNNAEDDIYAKLLEK